MPDWLTDALENKKLTKDEVSRVIDKLMQTEEDWGVFYTQTLTGFGEG